MQLAASEMWPDHHVRVGLAQLETRDAWRFNLTLKCNEPFGEDDMVYTSVEYTSCALRCMDHGALSVIASDLINRLEEERIHHEP